MTRQGNRLKPTLAGERRCDVPRPGGPGRSRLYLTAKHAKHAKTLIVRIETTPTAALG